MKKILSVIISLCLIFPVCNVQAFRLEPFYLGLVAKHIPENDKRNFAQVSNNSSVGLDCSGYVNKYLELYSMVMCNCKEKNVRNYKIKTPEDFLKIYDLLNSTQFRILRAAERPNCDFIYTNHPDEENYGYYVLFPMNYQNLQLTDYQEYYENLKIDYQNHLHDLRRLEHQLARTQSKVIENHCIRPEVFFQVCFDINDNMYPTFCYDINKKNEFRAKLQDFLVKQTISWTNSMSLIPKINKIPNPTKFLTLKELDYLRENLSNRYCGCSIAKENKTLKTSFVNTQDPEDVFNGKVYDFQIQHVIDGLWKQNKLTKNYNYVADIKGKKLRLTPNEDGNIACLEDSTRDSVLDSSNLKEWKTYKSGRTIISSAGSQHHPISRMCDTWKITFDWLCGLDYKSFQHDFDEFVCNCDTYKIYKIKKNLLESFEYLSGTKRYGSYTPTSLDYLGEVLFEDENNNACINHDGILNLLYIFDFFKFPTSVTDKIIGYVFAEMIKKSPSINDLGNNNKFEEIIKLVTKLWSIDNNTIFLELKDALISRVQFKHELNSLELYCDFVSHIAGLLNISVSDTAEILSDLRESLHNKTEKLVASDSKHTEDLCPKHPALSRTMDSETSTNNLCTAKTATSELTPEYTNISEMFSDMEQNTKLFKNSNTSTNLTSSNKNINLKTFEYVSSTGALLTILKNLFNKITKKKKLHKNFEKINLESNIIKIAS